MLLAEINKSTYNSCNAGNRLHSRPQRHPWQCENHTCINLGLAALPTWIRTLLLSIYVKKWMQFKLNKLDRKWRTRWNPKRKFLWKATMKGFVSHWFQKFIHLGSGCYKYFNFSTMSQRWQLNTFAIMILFLAFLLNFLNLWRRPCFVNSFFTSFLMVA